MISFLQVCLLEYAVHRTGCEIICQMSGNGYPAGFLLMFVLAVASFGGNKVPSIGFDDPDDFPHFQDGASSTVYLYTMFLHFRFLWGNTCLQGEVNPGSLLPGRDLHGVESHQT